MYVMISLCVCWQRGREVLQGAMAVVEEEAKASRQELLLLMEAEIKTRYTVLYRWYMPFMYRIAG